MPGGDRTGPLGFGPMTGRAAGYCAGFAAPGYVNPIGARLGMGLRRGFGRGFGRGAGRGFHRGGFMGYQTFPSYPSYGVNYPYQGEMDSKQEMELLQTEAENIKAELDAVNKRIAELKKDTKE